MTFDVGADAYARFMGRYSEPLADDLVGLLDLRPGQRVLDVGCGPGAMTARLVDRLGADAVAAVDPSPSFVASVAARLPGVHVTRGAAEALPFPAREFDSSVAQLVVHFMTDPVAGLAEMGRVTRPGGRVAACVWDHAGTGGPLSLFWRAVHDVDPGAQDEAGLPGAREGHLAELFAAAGLGDVERSLLTVTVPFDSFEDWWDGFSQGVGPAGVYVAGLDEATRERLRSRCAELLPPMPCRLAASAWTVVARV